MSAVVRPRLPWEAVDLGTLLVRRSYPRMLLTSGLVVLPVLAILAALLPGRPALVAMLVWWLKPAWERVHLHVLSRSLFGDLPSVRDTLRAFPRFVWPGLLGALTVRRFSPLRSFDLPVSMLEGLRGNDFRQRIGVLRRGPSVAVATWLTLILVHVETFLAIGVLGLVFVSVPETVELPWWDWLMGEGVGAWARVSIGVLTFLVVAPFYVGGGFALYLNRRTRLEAWDLEIAFRRAAGRLSSRRRGVAASAATVAAVLASLLLAGPRPAGAEPGGLDPERARREIRAVLAGEEFHQHDTVSLPRFVLDWRLDEEVESDEAWWPDWLGQAFAWLFAGLAEIGRVLLVAAAILLLGWLGWRYAPSLGRLRPDAGALREPPSAPALLFGMPVTEASLPADVPARARALWSDGRPREALALLYRASLARLIAQYRVPLREGSTEAECVALARPRLPDAQARLFAALTGAWQRVAYAHTAPPEARFAELCTGFDRHMNASDRPRPVAGTGAGEGGPDGG